MTCPSLRFVGPSSTHTLVPSGIGAKTRECLSKDSLTLWSWAVTVGHNSDQVCRYCTGCPRGVRSNRPCWSSDGETFDRRFFPVRKNRRARLNCSADSARTSSDLRIFTAASASPFCRGYPTGDFSWYIAHRVMNCPKSVLEKAGPPSERSSSGTPFRLKYSDRCSVTWRVAVEGTLNISGHREKASMTAR
jgi:hypothetical protein